MSGLEGEQETNDETRDRSTRTNQTSSVKLVSAFNFNRDDHLHKAPDFGLQQNVNTLSEWLDGIEPSPSSRKAMALFSSTQPSSFNNRLTKHVDRSAEQTPGISEKCGRISKLPTWQSIRFTQQIKVRRE